MWLTNLADPCATEVARQHILNDFGAPPFATLDDALAWGDAMAEVQATLPEQGYEALLHLELDAAQNGAASTYAGFEPGACAFPADPNHFCVEANAYQRTSDWDACATSMNAGGTAGCAPLQRFEGELGTATLEGFMHGEDLELTLAVDLGGASAPHYTDVALTATFCPELAALHGARP